MTHHHSCCCDVTTGPCCCYARPSGALSGCIQSPTPNAEDCGDATRDCFKWPDQTVTCAEITCPPGPVQACSLCTNAQMPPYCKLTLSVGVCTIGGGDQCNLCRDAAINSFKTALIGPHILTGGPCGWSGVLNFQAIPSGGVCGGQPCIAAQNVGLTVSFSQSGGQTFGGVVVTHNGFIRFNGSNQVGPTPSMCGGFSCGNVLQGSCVNGSAAIQWLNASATVEI